MIESLTPPPIDRDRLDDFMQIVRATVDHDLRTPLSTIVACVAILEEGADLDLVARQGLLARIRRQALQTAEMLALAIEATSLAATASAAVATDPAELLQSVVAELEGEWVPRRAAPRIGRSRVHVENVSIERAIVRFAWRGFLLLDKVVAARPLTDIEIGAEDGVDGVQLDLGFRLAGSGAPLDLDALARGSGSAIPRPHRLALRIGRDLVRSRGGELEVNGTLGVDARLLLRLPHPA